MPAKIPPVRRESRDRLVLFVAFPDMCVLDLSGPQTVFWRASTLRKDRGLPGYACHTVSMDGGPIRAAEGVVLDTRAVSEFRGKPIDTLMVPGSFSPEALADPSGRLTRWLKQVSARTRRMTSVCSGAFLLARAGLLQGKRAATHWLMCDTFQAQFPGVEVDRNAIFVCHGSVWTSAGVTSCIDLSLALVEADCGREIGMRVARELVVFMKRPGGQSQFSQFLQWQMHDSGVFDELHLWMGNNLGCRDLTVEVLAEQVGMSPRHFARLYRKATGRTPARALAMLRLEAARRMLEDSDRSVKQIARLCGFGNAERMRTTFLRTLSVAPREYRQRFSTAPAPPEAV